MRVLIACEFSGVVRRAFIERGHDAWSCDLLPSEQPGQHLQCDVLSVLQGGVIGGGPFDLMIAHPPCTHLAVSGARWFKDKLPEQEAALEFVRRLLAAPIPMIALENPVSIISSRIRKPDQIIQPWQFGHPETKTTCLWLKGLKKLEPADVTEPDYMRNAAGEYYRDKKGKRYSRVHFMSGRMKDAERWKERSRTFTGIAKAMAEQWG